MLFRPWAQAGPDRDTPAARPPATAADFKNSRRVQGAGSGCSAMVPSLGNCRKLPGTLHATGPSCQRLIGPKTLTHKVFWAIVPVMATREHPLTTTSDPARQR